MAAKKIIAKKIVYDIRAGMSLSDLITKYKISSVALLSLLKKLVYAGALNKSEIREYYQTFQICKCPAYGITELEELDDCPKGRITISKSKEIRGKSIAKIKKDRMKDEHNVGLDFIKPNKFRLRFTFYSILIGSFLIGILLNYFIFFHWSRISIPGFPLLALIHNSVSLLFSNFFIMPFTGCMASSGFEYTCFFSEMLKILILQVPVFYSLACLLDKADRQTRVWRIYFFIITLIHLFSYSDVITSAGISEIDRYKLFFDIPLTLTALFGLYLLAFRKKIFTAMFWKTFFCIYIAWDFIINIFMGHLGLAGIIQGIVLFGPLYIALYFYGFKFWKVES